MYLNESEDKTFPVVTGLVCHS